MKKTYIQPAMRSKELGTEEMMAGSLNDNDEKGNGAQLVPGVQKVQGLELESEEASSSLPKAANVWE